MALLSVISTLVFFVLVFVEGSSTDYKTPKDFEKKYLDHCFNRLDNETQCKDAWKLFCSAFAGKDPSSVTGSDYKEYFEFLPINAESNESLFWTGTYYQANALSYLNGTDLVSSSNTPSAAIINDIGNIKWCGNATTGGIEYNNPCPRIVTKHFWDQFSIEFALVAGGTIFYLCNGEDLRGAYPSNSSFNRYEIPSLEYPRVTGAVVLNIHRKGEGEACGAGSLVDLQKDIESKNISYTCYNIYGNVADKNEIESISTCSSIIVKAIQKGGDPGQNDCFEAAHKENDYNQFVFLPPNDEL